MAESTAGSMAATIGMAAGTVVTTTTGMADGTAVTTTTGMAAETVVTTTMMGMETIAGRVDE
ncbi:hypothetical protein [Archangium sp.]|jgi:hypothetical protein|uniref:hypothetical protein n=1 Tax=Archangium sp. TaxID=1872627 RepID=UPI002ED979FB